jgi:DNA-directed RNA polymerase specialized sigma24 family protein
MRRTDEQELSDLQDRLRRHLSATGLDTALADDLPHLAVLLMERQKDELWPRWPRWLHRLVHRNSAAR